MSDESPNNSACNKEMCAEHCMWVKGCILCSTQFGVCGTISELIVSSTLIDTSALCCLSTHNPLLFLGF